MGLTRVLMANVLEKLQLSICTFRQDGCAEGLHDLLDRYGLSSKLIPGGTVRVSLGQEGGDASIYTRLDRKHPCLRVVDPCIYLSVSSVYAYHAQDSSRRPTGWLFRKSSQRSVP